MASKPTPAEPIDQREVEVIADRIINAESPAYLSEKGIDHPKIGAVIRELRRRGRWPGKGVVIVRSGSALLPAPAMVTAGVGDDGDDLF